jgi:hypothetical protein
MPVNVAAWDKAPAASHHAIAVLVNPLHKVKRPEGLRLGKMIFATEQAHRRIAVLFPKESIERHAWFVRRPQGQIFLLAEKDSEN